MWMWGVVQQQAYQLRVLNIDKQKQCLLSVWLCMDHCVTDDATIDILLHVCGQMWTLEQYYDSINVFPPHDMKCFIFAIIASFVTFNKRGLF